MQTEERFKSMLSGGHPNSLGRTVEVVEQVLADQKRLTELFDCYTSTDATVRLRTSNALKRIARSRPECLATYLDRLINHVAKLDQASAQWTLATLFHLLESWMTSTQKMQSTAIMQLNLTASSDWIVLNTTMETLTEWAQADPKLKFWLLPHLARLGCDKRGSVSRKAGKMTSLLSV